MASPCSLCYSCSAYHGHVSSLIDISPYKFHQLGECEQNQHVHVVSAEKPLKPIEKHKFAHASTPTCIQQDADLLSLD